MTDLNFGTISAPRPGRETLGRDRFRMAILGDFSGRAARGVVEIGDDLASRRPIKFDVDNVEDIIEEFASTIVLPLGKDGQGIEVALGEFDDLHPDELYENVEIFDELSGLRQRLKSGSMAPAAVASLLGWGEQFGALGLGRNKSSAGSSVPADRKLSAFSDLIGDAKNRLATASPAADLVARIVAPHVVAAPDEDTPAMISAVDEALSDAMRLVLHNPEFQSIETQWRTLDLLARRIETDDDVELILFDVSAEEMAADLAAQDDVSQGGLYRMLGENRIGETGTGGFSAIFGLYTFEETPPHAELLGRMARIAAHLDAPFFTAISPEFLKTPKKDRHKLVAEAWDGLRAMVEAKYLGLASPRFMLRRPYGARSEPIDPFEFEEFTEREGLRGMLWGNPVVLAAILLAETRKQGGGKLDLGSVMSVGDMPFHYCNDRHGDQVALPCTERNLTTSKVEDVVVRGLMPLLSIRGRDEIRLGSFQSLGGDTIRGSWNAEGTEITAQAPARAPDVEIAIAAAPEPAAREAAEPPEPETAPEDDTADELDALLAGLDDDAPAEPEEAAGAVEADDGMDELDALLAGLDSDEPAAKDDDGDMDAELAALLEDL